MFSCLPLETKISSKRVKYPLTPPLKHYEFICMLRILQHDLAFGNDTLDVQTPKWILNAIEILNVYKRLLSALSLVSFNFDRRWNPKLEKIYKAEIELILEHCQPPQVGIKSEEDSEGEDDKDDKNDKQCVIPFCDGKGPLSIICCRNDHVIHTSCLMKEFLLSCNGENTKSYPVKYRCPQCRETMMSDILEAFDVNAFQNSVDYTPFASTIPQVYTLTNALVQQKEEKKNAFFRPNLLTGTRRRQMPIEDGEVGFGPNLLPITRRQMPLEDSEVDPVFPVGLLNPTPTDTASNRNNALVSSNDYYPTVHAIREMPNPGMVYSGILFGQQFFRREEGHDDDQ